MAELPVNALFSQAVSNAPSKVGKPGMDLKLEQFQATYTPFARRESCTFVATHWICEISMLWGPAFLVWIQGGPSRMHTVLVVSPFLSLMADQVTSLWGLGVRGAIMGGHKGVDSELQVWLQTTMWCGGREVQHSLLCAWSHRWLPEVDRESCSWHQWLYCSSCNWWGTWSVLVVS